MSCACIQIKNLIDCIELKLYTIIYGFKRSFPVVFRPSRSVCALATSASGYVSWILTFNLPLIMKSKSSAVYVSNSSRVTIYWNNVGLITLIFFADNLEMAKGGTAPDYSFHQHLFHSPIYLPSPNSEGNLPNSHS